MADLLLETERFALTLPEGWADLTQDLGGPDGPLTLGRPTRGVGTLQFSACADRGGDSRTVEPAVLSLLLYDFASKQGWGAGFDHTSLLGDVTVEGASYCVGDEIVRAWYISDGNHLVFAAYVCEWEDRDIEMGEAECVVSSLEFRARVPDTAATGGTPR